MSEQSPDEEKKIIVDEDWKSQVEREREDDAKQQEEKAAQSQPLPPASLATLASTIMSQIMAALGQFPNPVSGKPEVDLNVAKHLIDTLDVIYQKTDGNRTAEETALYDNLLHQLRLAFVSAQSSPPAAAEPDSKIEVP